MTFPKIIKQLRTLQRIEDHQLNTIRLKLAQLDQEQHMCLARIAHGQATLLSESQHTDVHPAMMVTREAYINHINKQIYQEKQRHNHILQQMEHVLQQAREQFTELKKIDQNLDNRLKQWQQHQNTTEQKNLDEVAQQQFLRNHKNRSR